MNKRKEKLQDECIQLTKLKDSIDIKEKRKYNAMVNKITRLEKELKNLHSNYDKQIIRLNSEIENLGGNEEITPNTEVEPEEVIPDSKLVDIMCYDKVTEGVEIKHLKFTNHYNKPVSYQLLHEHGELFLDE
jgi:predicted RNase H-like nuclease (RuvC/YqgF family)